MPGEKQEAIGKEELEAVAACVKHGPGMLRVLKQTYKVFDGNGKVLKVVGGDIGAWSVQFQPDVTQDTCQGVWCAPFNGFQKKR